MSDSEVRQMTERWMRKRNETVSELRKFADAIDNHAANSRIANVTGAGISVAGGITAAACLVAAPFTGGISAIPALAAGGLGLAGGAVSLGTAITKGLIEKGILEEVQTKINEDREFTNEFMQKLTSIVEVTGMALKGARGVTATVRFLNKIVGGGAGSGAKFIARFGRAIGVVLGVALLPFDVYELVTTSIDIGKKTPSQTAEEVRKIANEFEKQLNEISAAFSETF